MATPSSPSSPTSSLSSLVVSWSPSGNAALLSKCPPSAPPRAGSPPRKADASPPPAAISAARAPAPAPETPASVAAGESAAISRSSSAGFPSAPSKPRASSAGRASSERRAGGKNSRRSTPSCRTLEARSGSTAPATSRSAMLSTMLVATLLNWRMSQVGSESIVVLRSSLRVNSSGMRKTYLSATNAKKHVNVKPHLIVSRSRIPPGVRFKPPFSLHLGLRTRVRLGRRWKVVVGMVVVGRSLLAWSSLEGRCWHGCRMCACVCVCVCLEAPHMMDLMSSRRSLTSSACTPCRTRPSTCSHCEGSRSGSRNLASMAFRSESTA
mmetsp:Transcript_19488/g.44233  ORF Transcript_19488/g.44233 Transcript_19488/m.44233 type:complete len:324 (+) Transcript_19488:145-1116(+)